MRKLSDFIFFKKEKGIKKVVKKILSLMDYLDKFDSEPYNTIFGSLEGIISEDLEDCIFYKEVWEELLEEEN